MKKSLRPGYYEMMYDLLRLMKFHIQQCADIKIKYNYVLLQQHVVPTRWRRNEAT